MRISDWSSDVCSSDLMALGLSPGSPVYRFTRIRYADTQSMALEHATIPARVLESPDMVADSLYKALGDHRPVRVLQRLRAVLFTPEQAELLGIAAASAGSSEEHTSELQSLMRNSYAGL